MYSNDKKNPHFFSFWSGLNPIGFMILVFLKLILILVLSPVLRADFVTLWELGADDNSLSDFSQEGGQNQSPGFVSLSAEVPVGSENDPSFNLSSKDDDYYFAGLYPNPIGLVDSSEPWKAFERALVPGDGTNRIHFTLNAQQAAITNIFRFTVDTFFLGSVGLPGTHDLRLLVNGQEILTQNAITTPALLEKVVSASAINAIEGENVFEISRIGGSDASWIQFDYIKAEVSTVPEPKSFLASLIVCCFGILYRRRPRRSA
jgi:hypothetical protein